MCQRQSNRRHHARRSAAIRHSKSPGDGRWGFKTGSCTDIKDRYNKVPWRSIAGMRDKIIHRYFGIDAEVLWVTVKEDLPKMRHDVSNIIQEIKRKGVVQDGKREDSR
ncbi:MAG: DUF86 domain-containing protein [Methanotrichaceae archaeon]|nr:DUF86 domain-containing protein [Methanotrichaceae archaeon]